jgi:hypothetical protein
MVDQTTLGHRLLLQEFGVKPTVGWQLDPFGHSATQAALLSADAGFDALVFGGRGPLRTGLFRPVSSKVPCLLQGTLPLA